MFNCKTPSIDQIHNFWLKKFVVIHEKLTLMLEELLIEPHNVPSSLTMGIRYLIPKTAYPTGNLDDYKPITCLSTTYKLFISIIRTKACDHVYNRRNRKDVAGVVEDVMKRSR